MNHLPSVLLILSHGMLLRLFLFELGAFKADLFRYCVLLIRGGVYADMDVLLETNLDDAIASDIGFMTPIDEASLRMLLKCSGMFFYYI